MSTRCKGSAHLFPHETFELRTHRWHLTRVRRGQGDQSKRATTALFAASALHALVLVALLAAPLRRRTPQAPQVAPLEVSEVAIEVAREEEKPSPSDDEVATRTSRSTEAPRSEPTAALPAPPSTAEATPAPLSPSPSSPSALSGSPLVMTRPSSPPAIGLALGTPNAFIGPANGATLERPPSTSPAADERRPRTAAEAKRAVEAALREPARQRERDLGLGPEGPVLAALGEATSASSAPVKGRAVFRAVADGTGMIVGIEVVECDGGRPGWANAAELARRALQGKKLRMPSSATLAEMRIEIVSDWKMPSGHDPGTDVSVLGVPVAKGEGKKSTKIDLLDPIPKLVTVELAPDVKVAVPMVNLGIIAVQGDPADIGARPRRVVHTRLLDSKVL